MGFLKSHRGAMAVAVIVVALSVLFGFHRSATAARADVEALFYAGTGGASIQTDLEDCLGITANLLTVGERYLDAGELARLEGRRNMLSDWHGIDAAYTAYEGLMAEAEAVLLRLEDCGLTEQDAKYVRGFRADLAARADTIARDPYNQAVDQFNQKKLGVFPANLLKQIAFVREAEAFR